MVQYWYIDQFKVTPFWDSSEGNVSIALKTTNITQGSGSGTSACRKQKLKFEGSSS